MIVGGVARRTGIVRVETRTRPGIVGEIAHTSALPDGAIGQANAEELDPSVGARPRVVAIVAAMRAPPSH